MNLPEIYPLPNAPQIDGLIFRHFEGEADYPRMLAIYTNLHAVEQFSGETTLESLRAEFSNLSNCDPHDDLIFADINGQTVAFCQFFWIQQIATQEYAYGIIFRVDPSWQSKGFEQAFIEWGESRGRHYASVLPEGKTGFLLVSPARKIKLAARF